jgi:hypothetical protein
VDVDVSPAEFREDAARRRISPEEAAAQVARETPSGLFLTSPADDDYLDDTDREAIRDAASTRARSVKCDGV